MVEEAIEKREVGNAEARQRGNNGRADGEDLSGMQLAPDASEKQVGCAEGTATTFSDGGNLKGYYKAPFMIDRRSYISNAKIQSILEAPAKFFARYGEGVEPKKTAAMEEGAILHEWALRPDEFERRVIIHRFKDFRTKESQEWKKNQARDALIMNEHERDKYRKIVDRLYENPLARDLLSKSKRESHGYANDPETGSLLYSRPDFNTTDEIIGELKFVASSEPDAFQRQQFNEGWFIQGGFYNYVDGLIRGEHRPQNFLYIAVEKLYPHITEIYPLGEVYEEMAMRKIRKGITLITEYMQKDPALANRSMWPGYVGKAKELVPTYPQLASDPEFYDLIDLGGK